MNGEEREGKKTKTKKLSFNLKQVANHIYQSFKNTKFSIIIFNYISLLKKNLLCKKKKKSSLCAIKFVQASYHKFNHDTWVVGPCVLIAYNNKEMPLFYLPVKESRFSPFDMIHCSVL
jgi:hypothetical protein